MRRGEAAYTDPAAALPPRAAGPMVAALAAGAAIPATLHILGDGLGWGPEQVGDAIAAAGVTPAPEPEPEPRERELVASFAPAAAAAQRRRAGRGRARPPHSHRSLLPHRRRRRTTGAAARVA